MTHSSRFISAPQRSSTVGSIHIGLSVLLLTLVSFTHTVPPTISLSALVLLATAWLFRDPQPKHLAVFAVTLIAVRYLLPGLRPWPYTLLIPLLASFCIGLLVPNMRRSFSWLRCGALGKEEVISIAVVASVSGIALYIWVVALKPDLALHVNNIPHMPLWLFPLAGLAFAAANAAMEEFIYRGLIMQVLDSAAGAGVLSLLVQAWLFGAMHYLHGFPNAGWGVAMTFIYGVMLGWLRRRSQGLLASWIAHVFADLVIFIVVVGVAAG